jgi:transposase, IS5 family
MGDVLNQIKSIMDWEIFMPVLERIPIAEAKGPGGRPGFHPMFMFKILVLQSLFGLSDEQTQYQILDRRSFHDFLDISEADTVPDKNTIREFREKLTRAQLHDELFAAYTGRLQEKGFIPAKATSLMLHSSKSRASATAVLRTKASRTASCQRVGRVIPNV